MASTTKKYLTTFFLLAVQLVLLFNLKFTAWPEMLLWPYLIIKGWPPYQNIAIAHTPLMLVKLAIFYKIFGVGILQLKIFTWILILALDFLVFWITKKLWNVKTAMVALGTFIFWQLFFDGNGLWFDVFMGVLALGSFYFVRTKKYLWAGVFWALAIISKQTAVWFFLPVAWQIAKSEKRKVKSLVRFAFGSFAVFTPFVLILYFFGILPSFYEWAIRFGLFILPKAQGQIQLPDLKNLAISVFPFLIFVPLIWKTGSKNINLLLWTVAGSLGAYPRFEYFHFQPAIPFLAFASGIVSSELKNYSKYLKVFVLLYILGSLYLFSGFMMRNWGEGVRFYEQDVRDIVSYVDSNMRVGDKIFVLNWWDSIYALSNRLPGVDPWVPQLSWYMELPGVQEKMVDNLKGTKPKLIIFYPYAESGLSAYTPQKVYDFVKSNYKFKEKIDNLEILTPR